MSVIDIFGIELEIDFMDADILDDYLSANEKVRRDINDQSIYQGKSAPDKIREQCRIINEFFDGLFGDGISERLFHNKSNIRDHMEAFAIVTKAAQESNSELTSISDKYSINRAERRADERAYNKERAHSFQTYHAGNHGKKGKGK